MVNNLKSEVLVPNCDREHVARFNPGLQAPEAGKRNTSLLHSFEKMLPQASR